MRPSRKARRLEVIPLDPYFFNFTFSIFVLKPLKTFLYDISSIFASLIGFVIIKNKEENYENKSKLRIHL